MKAKRQSQASSQKLPLSQLKLLVVRLHITDRISPKSLPTLKSALSNALFGWQNNAQTVAFFR